MNKNILIVMLMLFIAMAMMASHDLDRDLDPALAPSNATIIPAVDPDPGGLVIAKEYNNYIDIVDITDVTTIATATAIGAASPIRPISTVADRNRDGIHDYLFAATPPGYNLKIVSLTAEESAVKSGYNKYFPSDLAVIPDNYGRVMKIT
ncbi:MAG: hypothetical protein PHS07_03440 [Patescibacteria group bacterium]|nr:hypothetical protein [Patescibacteria group bacterium]